MSRNSYWYEGLELLLQGQEEEAQMVWLSAIADGTPEEVEVWLAELVDVLKTEALKWETLGNYDKAWVIRQHIRENAPGDLNNLLHLIITANESALPLDRNIAFEEVIELLSTTSCLDLDSNLLLQALRELLHLELSSEITSNFSNACISFYQTSLEMNPKCVNLYYALGNIYLELGKLEEADTFYQNALSIDPKYSEAFLGLGDLKHKTGDYEQAISLYEKSLQLQPNANAYTNQGESLLCLHRRDEAIANWRKALELEPAQPAARLNLAIALQYSGYLVEAFSCLEQAPNHNTEYAYAYVDLGVAFCQADNVKVEAKCYQKAIVLKPNYELAYLNLAGLFSRCRMHEEAFTCYENLLAINPNSGEAYSRLGDLAAEESRTEEALNYYSEALRVQPDCIQARRMLQLILPVIYESEAEIDYWRKRYTEGLHNYIDIISHDLTIDKKRALTSIGLNTNFRLAYQGKNDFELQCQYGQVVNQVMIANYPQWSKPIEMPPLGTGDKIRIGYISPYFREHSVGRMTLGWIRLRDRNNFEVYVYYTDKQVDSTTERFQQESDFFRHIPHDLEACCRQISADCLHVLVFTDIGMHPQMTQMAGLRLAPIQCAWAGHPVTTGIPTVDYFLSSALMEPDNAQSHYSEKLICLPSLGLSYSQPKITTARKDRTDLNLPEENLIFLSCQTIWKYLPQYDYIFVEIASKVPKSKIVFCVSDPRDAITQKFRQRIESAFSKAGLDSSDRCIFLPRMDFDDYLSLLLVSDVLLDTIDFSGSNTTLQAIACNLPVVTMPGEFLKGRTSYSILSALGVTDTIADSESEYIDLAVKLGLDDQWRKEIVMRIESRHSYLYDDDSCIKGLEEFYKRTVLAQ